MSFFDLILCLILMGFVWFGFWHGLIRSLGGIIGIFLAVFIASRWYETVALEILPWLGDNLNLARLIGFILVFFLARFLVNLLIKILDKVFDLLSFIPFLKTINRLAGGFLGLIEGGLILGLILYFSTKFPLGGNWVDLLSQSGIAMPLINLGQFFAPLLPEALEKIQSLI